MSNLELRPRKQGKSTDSYTDFFLRARKGEKVRFMMLNGVVLSPALLQETLLDERTRTLEEALKELRKLKNVGEFDATLVRAIGVIKQMKEEKPCTMEPL